MHSQHASRKLFEMSRCAKFCQVPISTLPSPALSTCPDVTPTFLPRAQLCISWYKRVTRVPCDITTFRVTPSQVYNIYIYYIIYYIYYDCCDTKIGRNEAAENQVLAVCFLVLPRGKAWTRGLGWPETSWPHPKNTQQHTCEKKRRKKRHFFYRVSWSITATADLFTEHFFVPYIGEFHHPNSRSHIFQRGWLKPPTRYVF